LASDWSEICGAEGMLTCAASVGMVSAMLRASAHVPHMRSLSHM